MDHQHQPRNVCPKCDRTYRRSTHLRRHMKSHESATTFSCLKCERVFTRIDSLRRHHATRHANVDASQRLGRACLKCAQARVGCSRHKPCKHCLDKGFSCHYPEGATNVGGLHTSESDGVVENDAGSPIWPSSARPIVDSNTTPSLSAPAGTDVPNDVLLRSWEQRFSERPLSETIPGDGNSHTSRNSVAISSLTSTISAAESQLIQQSASSYAAGGGARDTRFRKLPRIVAISQRIEKSSEFCFPQLEDLTLDDEETSWQPVTPSCYSDLSNMFRTLCSTSNIFQPFRSSRFVSITLANWCMNLYFIHFHPTLPFLHRESLMGPANDPTLMLAIIAMGSFFADVEARNELVNTFHEFLRRAIILRSEGSRPANLAYIQASLLSVIGLFHVDHDWLLTRAPAAFNQLLALCMDDVDFLRTTHHSHDAPFREWQAQEERIRTVHCVWLFDSLMASQDFKRPYLGLDVIPIQLPSHQSLFDASDALEFAKEATKHSSPSSLGVLLDDLRADHPAEIPSSELAQMVFVYGLHNKTKQLTDHYYQKFALDSSNRDQRQASYPQLISWPLHALWRNQMCDHLDTLHWMANSVTARAAGVENPLVLHLHLARIILLTPCEDINEVAHFLLGEAPGRGRSRSLSELATAYPMSVTAIRHWLAQDGCKLRLAVVHAGAIFWHVRRYSVQGFCEPSALLNAALLLWTYCLQTDFLKPLTPDEQLMDHGTTTVAPQVIPPIDTSGHAQETHAVAIDRLLDDELIQIFIQGEEPVTVTMSRVGKLSDAGAPSLILMEAARLLRMRCSAWGVSSKYHDFLIKLAQPSQILRTD